MTAGWSTKRPFGYALPEKRRPQEVASLKLGSSPFPPQTMPPPRARVESLPRCVWTRVAELFGEIRRMQARKEAEPRRGGGASPLRQPQDWLVPGIYVCVQEGRTLGRRSPAPASQWRPRSTKPEAHSAPGNPGQAVTAAAAPPSRSTNGRACCRGAGPAPGRSGLRSSDWRSGSDRRRAVRAGGSGRASRGCRP